MLYTKDGKQLAVQELTFAELIGVIVPVNKSLANIMDTMAHELVKHRFYKASYRFGDTIIADGKCYLPLLDGGVIAFNHPNLPYTMHTDLSYDSLTEDPLALFLNRTSEYYMPSENKVLSHSLVYPGQMLGISRALHNSDVAIPASALTWHLNAGARSLLMLAQIGDKRFHGKLQAHYGMKLDAPALMRDHWQVFVSIAKYADSNWRCEVIYFPRKLINALKTAAFAQLAMELHAIHRLSYNVWHNVSAVWNNTFGDIEHTRGLINYPIGSLTTAKHMFMLAANSAVGFRPALTEGAAPIKLLQEAYANIYGLTGQNPSTVIMEPATFDFKANVPLDRNFRKSNDSSELCEKVTTSYLRESEAIYYSINYPTFAHNNLEAAKKKSQISLLDEIRLIHQLLIPGILLSAQHITSLYEVTKAIQFSYYHTNPEEYRHILDASAITKDDPRFTIGHSGTFPKNSAFFKGCIKIARKSASRVDTRV